MWRTNMYLAWVIRQQEMQCETASTYKSTYISNTLEIRKLYVHLFLATEKHAGQWIMNPSQRTGEEED